VGCRQPEIIFTHFDGNFSRKSGPAGRSVETNGFDAQVVFMVQMRFLMPTSRNTTLGFTFLHQLWFVTIPPLA